jgi:ppGpp synthetase/RelA/SpoT-type nucleotidyltranferase
MPWSKSAVGRLGKHLIASDPPDIESLAQLEQLLVAYDDALGVAEARVRSALNLVPTTRLKNTGTILEKLQRSGGGSLPNIQDIAGMRIVQDVDLVRQGELAHEVGKLFADGKRDAKEIDRRNNPVQGYRAIHVVVHLDDLPVEVQIRTRLQDAWANLYEKFADVVGRGIRYGGDPEEWTSLLGGLMLAATDNDRDNIRSKVLAELPSADEEVLADAEKAIDGVIEHLENEGNFVSLVVDELQSLSGANFALEMARTARSRPDEFGFEGVEAQADEGITRLAEVAESLAARLDASIAGLLAARERYKPLFDDAMDMALRKHGATHGSSAGESVIDFAGFRRSLTSNLRRTGRADEQADE